MRTGLAIFTIAFIIFPNPVLSQSLFDDVSGEDYKLGGFIRSGMYLNNLEKSLGVPVSFADLSLHAEAGDGTHYKAYADFRYRYASEYRKIVSEPVLREAWAAWYTPITELKAGKQINKWSSMDFFRLQDVISPRNDLYRSFDPADRDLGNISLNLNLSSLNDVSLMAILIPRFRPSVLYTEFMDMPEIIEIKEHTFNGSGSLSYGLRAEFFLRNFSASIAYFDGYNALPGLGLDTLTIAGNNGSMVSLEKRSFKTKTLSAGIEFTLGNNIIRSEAIWSNPDADYRQEEHVMLPEIRWAGGFEHFFGDLQVLIEYSGKYLIDYEAPAFDPALPDESSFSDIGTLPPQQIIEYTRQQIGAFNRLYNYQLDEYNHFAGLSLTYEKGLAILSPLVNILYNITAEEYMINPVLKIKPTDNIELIAGAEIYNGVNNSLFDMINDRLNSVYGGVRIDF
ncbi:MAG: hypothetical protein ACQERS_02095 [Bacteroidota bacterium]